MMMTSVVGKENDMKNLRFMYNGIRGDDGKLIPIHYSFKADNDNIILQGRDIMIRLPEDIGGSKRKNNSDLQSDYFETDWIVLDSKNKYYKVALENFLKAETKNMKKVQREYDLKQRESCINKIKLLLKGVKR